MVDASIGGKTAVDLGAVKNQLGCFSNPEAVFIWTNFLKTLPEEELLSGFGEIIKYALINDTKFWNIIREIDFSEMDNFNEFIIESIEIKRAVVVQDPKEQGLRKILNFGHTYGHAFESLSMIQDGGTRLSHGKAVALGIICELWHSVQKTGFLESDFIEIKDYIFRNFGSFSIYDNQIEQVLDLMKKDKKNSGNKIAVVLLENIGNAIIDRYLSEEEIRDCLHYYQKL
jgi:3-dehydroquinate synthase